MVVKLRLDVTDSARGKAVVRERREVTDSASGKGFLGIVVMLQTVQVGNGSFRNSVLLHTL